MNIRSLDLLDLPTVYRHRGEAISLDAVRALTRGNPLGAVGLLSYMNPERRVYSAICTDDGPALLGGLIQNNGDPFARLLYLAPASRLDHPQVQALIEHLTVQAGSWGAFHVLAEVDQESAAVLPLRRAGFSAYAGQRMWDMSRLAGTDAHANWPRARTADLPAIQNLHHQIVPQLLQPIEPPPKRSGGFICNQGGPCYASTASGLHGIVVSPLIHPDATDVAGKLAALIHFLPNRGGRPVYICVRTYQAWLEHVLADLGAKPGSQQAVMVKHLAHLVKDEQSIGVRQPAGVSVQPSRVTRFEDNQ